MSGYNLKTILFFCLKIFFTSTNSVDPDEMHHYAAFNLGLNCFQTYLFRGSGIRRMGSCVITEYFWDCLHYVNFWLPFISVSLFVFQYFNKFSVCMTT